MLDDDSDPDGHAFAISDTTDPLNGTVVVNADGTMTYTPNAGFVGVDTFTYTICVDITDGRIVAWLRFEGDVNEIFAVEALPGIAEPELVQSHEPTLDETWATPNGTLVK